MGVDRRTLASKTAGDRFQSSHAKKVANPLEELSWEVLFSFDRAMLRVNRLGIAWQQTSSLRMFTFLYGGKEIHRPSDQEWFRYFISRGGIFLAMYFAVLGSVLADLRNRARSRNFDLSFLKHYNEDLHATLNDFRNTVVHTQSAYWDDKVLAVLRPGIAKEVWKLQQELGIKISRAVKKRKPTAGEVERFGAISTASRAK